ncbi:integral membrane protein GPR180 isoform X2 [Genypterus blacodes]|uniref:integral membrane protein GPR180 isoform X2 n=1 Tax=Genypterus blacodes TaxID=154954 RepID=UPI003F769A84
MSYLFVSLVAAVLFSPETFGKTVTGLLKSEAAREQSGQFITAFMYQGDNGLLVCRLDNAGLAAEKEARLLLYQDLDQDLDKLDCPQRLARAQLRISLSQEEQNRSLPHQGVPTAWQLFYADRYTCQDDAVVPAHADLSFTVLLFNSDSAGNPLDHFSAEETGLHSFYFLLLLAYFIASCIYIQPLSQALRKGGPMHTVLRVLTVALALQGCSALCNYIHLARYSRDGVGFPWMGSLAELWDMVSQVSMLYMLLSLCVGWTLSRGRKPQSRPLQWERSPASTAFAVGGVVTQVGIDVSPQTPETPDPQTLTGRCVCVCVLQGALLLWEQFSESESDHHSFHGQHSMAALLLVALRVGLALLLASVLYQIISTERSTLKRDFYLCFAKGCFLWFLCHPALILLSAVFDGHQREKVPAQHANKHTTLVYLISWGLQVSVVVSSSPSIFSNCRW